MMEFCYPDSERKCQCGEREEKCDVCGKVVSDCEWITNWCSCSECFDRHWEKEEVGDDQERN